MTLAQTGLAQSSHIDPKPRRASSGTAGFVTRPRLAIFAAGILALAVLGAIGGKPASPTPERAADDSRVAFEAGIDSNPATTFDGRGKWRGYAR